MAKEDPVTEQTMRALMCESFGPPEALVLREVPVPAPGEGEVLIRVHAAGLNFPDSLIIENKYQFKPALPFAPGGELSGIVEAVGAGVDRFAPGRPRRGADQLGRVRRIRGRQGGADDPGARGHRPSTSPPR